MTGFFNEYNSKLLESSNYITRRQAIKIQAAFRTDEIQRTPPTPQDEMRAGISYNYHETIWKGIPKVLQRVDTTLKNVRINERVPHNASLIQFSSWMGGDREGNPRVTPEVRKDVCLLARLMAANLYYSQIEELVFEELLTRQKSTVAEVLSKNYDWFF